MYGRDPSVKRDLTTRSSNMEFHQNSCSFATIYEKLENNSL
jgi:hypothetical protein